MLISGALIYLKVRYVVPTSGTLTPAKQTAREKLARIDFLGCFLLAGFVGALLIAVSLKTSAVGDDEIKWSDPLIVGLFITSAVLFLVFLVVEFKVAKEPVLPLELLKRRTAISVAIHNLVFSIMLYAVVSSFLRRMRSLLFSNTLLNVMSLIRPVLLCTHVLYSSQSHVSFQCG